MPILYKTKGPKWKRVCGVDFAAAKEFTDSPPDTIASATVTLVSGTAGDLTIGSPSFSGTVVSFRVEGGVNGRKYVLEVKIVTAAGAVLTKQIGLQLSADAG